MTDTVVKVTDLGKRYLIGHRDHADHTFREYLSRKARGVVRRIRHPLSQKGTQMVLEDFWALRHVAFEIKRGDRLGIIGRNGAGKSTLLKLLSRITEPTESRIVIKGRVASLLEVGTGFHPELTGRENIYLNGAILGMSKIEIRKKFDEIVDFAEIEKFLDTPVKRYSSGMYVRLAFSVAAHLEPEILLVDEVLAVGDAKLQRKCLGKMENVAEQGRTVVFVSHNLNAIRNLCSRCLLLGAGKLLHNGAVQTCIHEYINSNIDYSKATLGSRSDRTGNGLLRFTDYKLTGANGNTIKTAICGERLNIHLSYSCKTTLKDVHVGIAIRSIDGSRPSSLATSLINKSFREVPPEGEFIIEIPRFPFNVGVYFILVDANINGTILDRLDYAFRFDVEEGPFYRNGKLPTLTNKFLVDFNFSLNSPADPQR